MEQKSPASTPPQGLPVLSRGKHRNPTRGACFMEYTSVLAGEPFTDSPQCVDAELAAVLRGANDMLSDEDRPALVPLLGRAIGLVVPAPEHPADRLRFWIRPRRDPDDPDVARTTSALRRAVSDRLLRAIEVTPSHPCWTWYGRHMRVSRLFWDLMNEPARTETSAAYAERLADRLDLLHRCYEDGLRDLGLPRTSMPTASASEACMTLSAAQAASGEC